MAAASQGTTEKLSYSSIFNPLIRRSTLYCNPVLLLGSISSAPRSVLAHYFGLKYNTGCGPSRNSAQLPHFHVGKAPLIPRCMALQIL